MLITKSVFYFLLAAYVRLVAATLFGFGCARERASCSPPWAPLCSFFMASSQHCNRQTSAASMLPTAGSSLFFRFYGGWQIDKILPDRFDIIGGIVALVGVVIIMYAPRA